MAIELISELTLKNGLEFPLIDSNKIRGGFYQVDTLEERDLIPDVRKKERMLCAVINDPNNVHYYQWVNGLWERAALGGNGIPIYTLQMIDLLGPGVGDLYITVPTPQELEGSIQNNLYITTQNGNYLDILFSSIRALLSEIARLKNTFKYGLYSYQEKKTAMSQIIGLNEQEEKEPLWAVDESELSEVTSVSSGLIPSENVQISGSSMIVTDVASWYDNMMVEKVTDPKLFYYLTTTNQDIKFYTSNNISFNLNNLNINRADIYNILVVCSRFQIINNHKRGQSYIWINVQDKESGDIIKSGYFNGTSLQNSIFEFEENFFINRIDFENTVISKFDVYSKYQDFTNSIESVQPSNEDYKYEVAHIQIRAVKNTQLLNEIKHQLLSPELIWNKYSKSLWIHSDGKLYLIGSNTNIDNDSEMTTEELLEELKNLGIVSGEGNTLSINKLGDITFVNEDTNKAFKFKVNAEGELVSQEINQDSFNDEIFKNISENNIRGFIGSYNALTKKLDETYDFGLNSDRLKIGAIYAPLESDKVFGCSHAYIELENTSDVDIPLNGMYLHWAYGEYSPSNAASTNCHDYHLALTGIIKAGSTYLIRGKQYASFDDANTYIKVDDYDQEWYIDGELIDLTCLLKNGYALALTYGLPTLPYNTQLHLARNNGDDKSKVTYRYPKYYIDSMVYYKDLRSESVTYWAPGVYNKMRTNCITKNTFELDPAKQAFQALNTYDSSRIRNEKLTTDAQYIELNNPTIRFYHSDEEYPVERFTPKSSKQNKNVSTDKTKLDKNKPNMVTCAFGIDIYKTRCFNWISCGLFDEYVFIKNGDSWDRYESYKLGDGVELPVNDLGRKQFTSNINDIIYSRITKRFPGDNSLYTSHKCIINITNTNVLSPTTYTYVVGRADKNGNPDLDHCSEEQTFTLYPNSYTPKIYQITDLQGFHWIEYQVWAAAANKLNEKINQDLESNIIPILINTGDMTLNGTRINEWLDYYNAGKVLFNHLEQMNVVGNNDLCGTDPDVLGTGDDIGKSNSFYFHVFYCYEVDTNIPPIINNKYVPSLYYFDTSAYRILMVNSEITVENCKNWFNVKDSNGLTVNIYTGWSIQLGSLSIPEYVDNFTTIYTMLYNYTSVKKKYIAVCHEMPFTVITNSNLVTTEKNKSRSANGRSLVGSHLNQLDVNNDVKALYWFSRLLEFRGVKLCIGGHKHTYACTYPVREYYFKNGVSSLSYWNDVKQMDSTLETDDVQWSLGEGNALINTTKFPLTKCGDVGTPTDSNKFYPCTPVSNLEGGIIYFMCQATGYKQTSNKELPSADQKFSLFLPKTTIKASDGSDSPSNELKYPMFGIISLNSSNITIKLVRIVNIMKESDFTFTQQSYSTSDMRLEYLQDVVNNGWRGLFTPTDSILITI